MTIPVFVASLMAAACHTTVQATACNSLDRKVDRLETDVRGLIRSFMAPHFTADLSRLSIETGKAIGTLRTLDYLSSHPALDASLHRALSDAKEGITSACQRCVSELDDLQDEVKRASMGTELDAHNSIQALGHIASMGETMMSRNSGTSIGDILMASHGSRMVQSAMNGHSRVKRRQKDDLGNTINNLFVPRLFVPSHDYVIQKARALIQQREQVTTTSTTTAVRKFTVEEGQFPPFECPRQLRTILDERTSTLGHRNCLLVYWSVIASQASYRADVPYFLQRASRPLARYLTPWSIRETDRNLDDLLQVFNVTGTDIIIVAFRGTTTSADVLSDLQFNTASKIPGGVHAGFYERSQKAPVPLIIELLRQGKHVVLTGHSLGGAAATVLTLRLFYEEVLGYEYYNQVTCVTFGAPLSTGSSGEDLRHAANFLHVVVHSDLVPRLLLLKKDIYDAIVKQVKEIGLTDMLKQGAERVKAMMPWKVRLLAELANMTLSSLYQSMDTENEWFKYKTFGEYVFLWKGQVFAQSEEHAAEFMKMLMPSLGASTFDDALRDHNLDNYAEALESLRGQGSSQREEL